MNPIIKKGDKHSKLTAIRFVEVRGRNGQFWLFGCACGNQKIIRVNRVKNGNTKSCGCLLKKGGNLRHGMKKAKIYNTWASMKARCLNKKNKSYKNYGGRGIIVCKEWMKFENFYEDMGNCPKGKTLDRTNNNGNYCKKNCHWKTRKEQQNNKRNNHLITYKNKTRTIAQWAEKLKINPVTLYTRIYRGWKIEKALII